MWTGNSLHLHTNKEDKLLGTLIQKCFELEKSQGMSRVIHRTLIRLYNDADKEFTKSKSFERTIKHTMDRLKHDPVHKFSHLKDLCETLKLHRHRKKVEFTTLATNLKETNSRLNGTNFSTFGEQNAMVLDVIDLDDNDADDIAYINLEHDNVDDTNATYNTGIIVLEDEPSSVHEVPVINLDDYHSDVMIVDDTVIQVDDEKENKDTNKSGSEDTNKLLVPKRVQELNENVNQDDKVKEIVRKINHLETVLHQLEEEEVNNDTNNSPYIVSDRVQGKIVALYKELCQITGARPIKRKEVRLKVEEGHPEGPVRKLETYLNNNIGSDGEPPFPDFCDVVNCVVLGLQEDHLIWNRAQIMSEASGLFTQCGRALQKRRQRREWRDLLKKVKLEECDTDPADNDPELLQRLQANKQMAMKKENAILERYTRMQTHHIPTNEATQVAVTTPNNISEVTPKNVQKEPRKYATSVFISSQTFTENSDVINNNGIEIKKEPNELIVDRLEELGENYTATVIDIEDPFLIIEISSESDNSSGDES